MSSIKCDMCSKATLPADKFSVLDKTFCSLKCLRQYKNDHPERFIDKFSAKPSAHINVSSGGGGRAY